MSKVSEEVKKIIEEMCEADRNLFAGYYATWRDNEVFDSYDRVTFIVNRNTPNYCEGFDIFIKKICPNLTALNMFHIMKWVYPGEHTENDYYHSRQELHWAVDVGNIYKYLVEGIEP